MKPEMEMRKRKRRDSDKRGGSKQTKRAKRPRKHVPQMAGFFRTINWGKGSKAHGLETISVRGSMRRAVRYRMY